MTATQVPYAQIAHTIPAHGSTFTVKLDTRPDMLKVTWAHAGVEAGEELFIVQRRSGAFLIAYYKGEGAHPKVVNDEIGRQVTAPGPCQPP